MPTPKPKVTTTTNPDGTVTTTTTTFYSNGSNRDIKVERRSADGELIEESKDEFRRGKGPNDHGTKEKSTKKELDSNENTDKVTITDYDKKGRPKDKTETEYDDQEEPTKVTKTKYKKGRKTQQKSVEFEDRQGRKFRTVITTIYCPDPEMIKKITTDYYYWSGQKWKIDKTRPPVVDKWDCLTGKKIAMVFPKSSSDAAILVFVALAILAFVLSLLNPEKSYWLFGVGALFVAGIQYWNFEKGRRKELLEDLETEKSFTEDLFDPEIEEEKEQE